MSVSNTFAAQPVGFCPVRIRLGYKNHLLVASASLDVTSSRQHSRPCLFVTVLDCVRMQEQMGQIIMDVDAHGLTGLYNGVEESRYLSAGLRDVEQPVLPAHSEWSDCVLGSLVAACGKRIIKKPDKCFPPVQKILKCSLQLSDGLVFILNTFFVFCYFIR